MNKYIVHFTLSDYGTDRSTEVTANYFTEEKGWIVFWTDPPKARVAAFNPGDVSYVKMVVQERG